VGSDVIEGYVSLADRSLISADIINNSIPQHIKTNPPCPQDWPTVYVFLRSPPITSIFPTKQRFASMTDTLSVPGWITIPFGKTSELKALGRNGYMQCHGVSVSIFGSDIHLEPIHSKGDIGRARVPVPFTAVRELRDALDTLMRHRYAAVALAPDPLAAPPTAAALTREEEGALAKARDARSPPLSGPIRRKAGSGEPLPLRFHLNQSAKEPPMQETQDVLVNRVKISGVDEIGIYRNADDWLKLVYFDRQDNSVIEFPPAFSGPLGKTLLEDPGGGPEILMSGSLFDGRTFKVTRYGWVHLPDETRYDMFIDGVMVAGNCTEDRIINLLVVQLAGSAGA
jgi:hypothetical protein